MKPWCKGQRFCLWEIAFISKTQAWSVILSIKMEFMSSHQKVGYFICEKYHLEGQLFYLWGMALMLSHHTKGQLLYLWEMTFISNHQTKSVIFSVRNGIYTSSHQTWPVIPSETSKIKRSAHYIQIELISYILDTMKLMDSDWIITKYENSGFSLDNMTEWINYCTTWKIIDYSIVYNNKIKGGGAQTTEEECTNFRKVEKNTLSTI